MYEMYLGSIFLWPLSWVPSDLMFCNGQILQMNEYQALYSLFGNIYGGDGRTTFALPDLRSRVPIGVGQGANLTPVKLAQQGGNENATLIAHTHSAQLVNPIVSVNGSFAVNNTVATTEIPTPGSTLAAIQTTDNGDPPVTGPALGYNNAAPNTPINGLSIYANLNGGSVNIVQQGNSSGVYANMQPFLGMNFVIVVSGIYPVRPN